MYAYPPLTLDEKSGKLPDVNGELLAEDGELQAVGTGELHSDVDDVYPDEFENVFKLAFKLIV